MMLIRWSRFNLYLMAFIALALVAGCKTAEGKRKSALCVMRVHLEAKPGAGGGTTHVPVYRDNPVMLDVETSPFLTEAEVTEARVIETVGGFALQIRLDFRGRLMLEQYTTANHGKRYAVFCQFPSLQDPKVNQTRWLAAPVISGRMSEGVLLFTPDASREEAHQIAVGLNNVAKENENTPGRGEGW